MPLKQHRPVSYTHLNGVFQYKYLLDGKEYTGNIRQKTLPNGKPFRGGDYNCRERWQSAEENDSDRISDPDCQINAFGCVETGACDPEGHG